MQHRGTARRRVMIVTADQPLTSDAREVTADSKPVGTIGTIDGQEGLMIGRLDRVRDALDDATALLVGSIALTAVRFITRLIAFFWPICIPGVSIKTICAPARLATPIMRCRVVCGRGLTIETFAPT